MPDIVTITQVSRAVIVEEDNTSSIVSRYNPSVIIVEESTPTITISGIGIQGPSGPPGTGGYSETTAGATSAAGRWHSTWNWTGIPTQGTLVSVRGKFIGGTRTGHGLRVSQRIGFSPWFSLTNGTGLDEKTSVPDGYRIGTAIYPARSDGGMACRLTASGEFTSGISATGNLSSSITGTGNTETVNLAGGVNLLSSITGSGNLSSLDMRGKARLSCTISIGASPSAEDIAQAVWNFQVQGNTSPGNTAEYIKKTLKRDEYLGLS